MTNLIGTMLGSNTLPHARMGRHVCPHFGEFKLENSSLLLPNLRDVLHSAGEEKRKIKVCHALSSSRSPGVDKRTTGTLKTYAKADADWRWFLRR